MAHPAKKQKLWGGRFTGAVDPVMERFNSSIGIDKVMWKQDIEGSKAYSVALEKAGVLSSNEGEQIRKGLDLVKDEWASGKFQLQDGDEDIHTANERRLTEIVGAVGGKVHTGRSRNDQVTTDVRLWMREALTELQDFLKQLISTAAQRAKAEVDILMPGFTHLQSAQPIRWSHWMLNHAWSWQRDAERLAQIKARINQMPLGSGALAGNPFPIDRDALAADLGFSGPMQNSLDGVTDRDFITEFLFWSSLCMTHMSKFAEDLIIFCSTEFGFVKCSDAYSTGSSLMPQKKNPDAAELLRGKAGRTIGNLVGLLTTMKGLPTAYNKDMQEDKENLFDSMDTVRAALQIATGVLATLTPQPDKMMGSLSSAMLATDLSEYLVRKGLPFRKAHHVVGEVVKLSEDRGCEMSVLPVADLKAICDLFTDDVLDVWDFEKSVERKDAVGGTSRRSVLSQAAHLEQLNASS